MSSSPAPGRVVMSWAVLARHTESSNGRGDRQEKSWGLWTTSLSAPPCTTMTGMSTEDPHEDAQDTGSGIGIDDLPILMREMFMQCVADAQATHDPQEDFDAFIDELWGQTSAAFGLVRREWLENAPQPWPALLEQQRGVAEAVLEGRLSPEDLQP